MALKDLLPAAEEWKRLQDLESTLVRRKAAGTFAGAIAAIAGALQILFTLADKSYFDKLLTLIATGSFRLDALDRKKAITLAVFFVSLLFYLLLRRTRVLVRESTEAFRYTFWIDPFQEVEGTPGARFKLFDQDRFALLHHDLMERLDQRIRRFSILQEAPPQDDAAAPGAAQRRRYSSHVHISGHYALREEERGRWVVHVMPIVRIGSASSPATLAHPVHFPLSKSPELSAMSGPEAWTLEVGAYRDIVEHVYSSVATEVYRQIESDVRTKIDLFPTAHLRSVALYHEAEDFARSNTIDAYERAIGLYREALRWYELARIETITRLFLRMPLLWRTEIRAQHEWARVMAGYAKCLIYRQRISALTGRARNVLYELPEAIGEAIEVLELLQKKIGKRRADSKLERLLAFLSYPRDSWFRRLFGISSTPVFKAQTDALFEIYLVDCLARHYLDRREEALSRLEDAAATAPDRFSTNPLYLFARGQLEAEPEESILYLRAAVDIDRDFQIARSSLADAYERTFRAEDEITPERATIVVDEYKTVLTLNYGNIQALSSLGFVCWLIRDPRARRFLEQGRQVKAIASQTYIGELSYRLARVAAEDGEFDECRNLYLEATAADPEVGVFEPGQYSVARSGLDVVGRNTVRRFESYLETVEKKLAENKSITEETRRAVYSFALNDFGNACLRYFHFHGNRYWLGRANKSYRRATEVNPTNALPWFNLQNVYGWLGENDKMADAFGRAKQLAPSWTSVAIAAATEQVRNTARAMETENAEDKRSEEALETTQQQLDEAVWDVEVARDVRQKRTQAGTQATKRGPQTSEKPLEQRLSQLQATSLTEPREPRDPNEILRQALETTWSLQKSIYEQLRRKEARRRRIEKMESEFKTARDEALKEIHKSSRLAALFDVQATLREQVARLRKIPVKKLERQDVLVMMSFAEILRYSPNVDECAAAETLACRLFDLHPEDYGVVSLLRDLVPRLPANAARQKLKERIEKQYGVIINKWIETESRNFLALYWYAGFDQGGPPRDWLPDKFSSLYFGDAPDLFENRRGWVLLAGWAFWRQGTLAGARKAFETAIRLRGDFAQYHFDLGQCLELESDFHGARVAYGRALKLAPDDRDYSAGLASAVNQIGHSYRREGRNQDAADLYGQSAALLPNEAICHYNVAVARADWKSPDEAQALNAALPAIEQAMTLEPATPLYSKEAGRIRRRIAALRTYGQTEQSRYVLAPVPVRVWYGLDLAPVVNAADAWQRYESLTHDLTERFIPKLKLNVAWAAAERIAPNSYQIGRSEVSLASGVLYPSMKFFTGSPDAFTGAGLTGNPANDPQTGDSGVWLDRKEWKLADANGLAPIDPLDFLMRHLHSFLLSGLHHLLGHQDVISLLKESPQEIRAIAESFEQTSWLTVMLKALLAERVSITGFDGLCDTFLEHYGTVQPPAIIEKMRSLTGIRESLWGNSEEDKYKQVHLGPKLEMLMEGGLRDSGPWTVLALRPEPCKELLAVIHSGVADVIERTKNSRLVLVTSKPNVRVHVRTLVALEFPDLPVLSAQELMGAIDEQERIDLP